LGRFRLFFRYDSRSRLIVYAWVNDERTLRQRGAKTDPYEVFRRMLAAGNPPNDWAALLKAARTLRREIASSLSDGPKQ
jgi:toxin YhaV